ncbi:MAG: Site-specific recombinase XerD, partial [Candidatus Woesebacteria bacterium GW2011_GWF2_46_8]
MTQEPLKSLLPKFVESLKEKGRSPATVLAYRADLEQLLNFLEGRQKVVPGQVVEADISSFRDSLLNEKYTPKSVSRKLNAVKTFASLPFIPEQDLMGEENSRVNIALAGKKQDEVQNILK